MKTHGLDGQDAIRINLTCLVDALSKFKKVPQAPGDEAWLMVESMSHKIEKSRLVFAPTGSLNKEAVSFMSVKLVAVLYNSPDGKKFLTWEVA